ncbi:MAG: hypothetical protein ABII02_02200 [Candidatus Magasanikbacteria bacterium]
MNIKRRLSLSFLILVLGAIIFFFAFRYFKSSPPGGGTTPETDDTEEVVEIDETDMTPISPVVSIPEPGTVEPVQIDAGENYVKQLARIFVERFRSNSNQNDNRHIDDILPMATENMKSWIESQRIEQSGDYRGITTQVIVSNVQALGDATATVHIEVQEFLEVGNSKETNYRTGTVNLQKVGGEWKVSGMYYD